MIIDIILVVLKYPYKKYGKILMEMKISDENLYCLFKLQK